MSGFSCRGCVGRSDIRETAPSYFFEELFAQQNGDIKNCRYKQKSPAGNGAFFITIRCLTGNIHRTQLAYHRDFDLPRILHFFLNLIGDFK